jgi:uncharacterized protein YjbJ (UPF0337 family)
MKNDRIKGKAKQIEGRALRTIGKVTGSRKTQAKGMLRQAEGIVQEERGRGEAIVRSVTRSRSPRPPPRRPRVVEVEKTKTVVRTRRR